MKRRIRNLLAMSEEFDTELEKLKIDAAEAEFEQIGRESKRLKAREDAMVLDLEHARSAQFKRQNMSRDVD